MSKPSFKTIINICLLVGIIIGSTYLTTPTKATDKISILVMWKRIKVLSTYDENSKGEFRIQVKYYTGEKWKMDESAKYQTAAMKLDDDPKNPEIYFQLRYDVPLASNIYIRMIEADSWVKDDQVIRPVIQNSGSKINDGNWKIGRTITGSTWETMYVEECNDHGDYFKICLINLDY